VLVDISSVGLFHEKLIGGIAEYLPNSGKTILEDLFVLDP
jgi:hypothetical protein